MLQSIIKIMKYLITLAISFILFSAYSQTLEFSSDYRLMLGTLKEKTASIGLGDIDNDGDIDIVAANGRHWPQQNRVFFNSGEGIFTVSQPLNISQSLVTRLFFKVSSLYWGNILYKAL
jgi:hypothetical protein